MTTEAPAGSRDRILRAAVEVFAERGKHGARMEEIGERAKVNKAMVYYYFSSKKNLFGEVLVTIVREVFGAIHEALDKKLERPSDPVEVLRAFVSAHFDAIARNPRYAKILMEAVADDPDGPRRAFEVIRQESAVFLPERLFAVFEEGIRQGALRRMDPAQTLISIIGLNLVYFVAAPIAETVLNLRVEDGRSFQLARKKSILDLLLHGVLKEGKKP